MNTLELRAQIVHQLADISDIHVLEEINNFISIVIVPTKSELKKSIDEARNGKYFIAKNAKDAIAKCLA
jgi:hypothetical protein